MVVGGGAAGLSAALVLGRSCRRVVVCDDGRPRNGVVRHMHGFLTRDGASPADMLRIARDEAARYPGVRLVAAHVDSISPENGSFVAQTDRGERFAARRLLLACGVFDALPAIDGLRELWGRSVFVCPYCDGWEVRDRRVAVAGSTRKAFELAQELWQWSDDLLVCADGEGEVSGDQRRWAQAVRAELVNARILRVEQNDRVALFLSNGSTQHCDALFLCAPLRQRYDLVEMLGVGINADGEIAVDKRGRTNVPGVYAAGDAVTSVHQVVLAAASGVTAAMAVNEDLLEEEVRKVSHAID